MVGELDYGKIGITDKGDFVPGTTVCEELDGVTYDNQYWISLDNDNSTTPSTESQKWHRALDGKTAVAAAISAAALANEKAALANEKAGLADTKAGLADAAAQAANEAADAALAAVVTAELPEFALESDVRAIVTGYTPSVS